LDKRLNNGSYRVLKRKKESKRESKREIEREGERERRWV
jgi:hypothetical protein